MRRMALVLLAAGALSAAAAPALPTAPPAHTAAEVRG